MTRHRARRGGWLGVVGLGLGATYLASLLYLRGLKVLGATTTALLVSLEAPIALGLAALLIGERFVPVGLVGVGLVLVSSLLVIGRPAAATSARTRVSSDSPLAARTRYETYVFADYVVPSTLEPLEPPQQEARNP